MLNWALSTYVNICIYYHNLHLDANKAVQVFFIQWNCSQKFINKNITNGHSSVWVGSVWWNHFFSGFCLALILSVAGEGSQYTENVTVLERAKFVVKHRTIILDLFLPSWQESPKEMPKTSNIKKVSGRLSIQTPVHCSRAFAKWASKYPVCEWNHFKAQYWDMN